MRRGALLLAALLIAGCNFSERLDEYCRNEGTCSCDQGACCVVQGATCEEGLCCDGLLCASDGVCRPDVPVVEVVATQTEFPPTMVGSTASLALQASNHGYAASAPLDLTLSGDVDPFALAAGTCDGQVLAAGASCSANVSFNPTRGGDFRVSLEVQTGDGVQTVSFHGSSQVEVSVEANFPDRVHLVSSPAGIDCSGNDAGCSAILPMGAVTFSETHGPGVALATWLYCKEGPGGCAAYGGEECGAETSCKVWVDAPTTVSAHYEPWLTVWMPNGGGWITSTPEGIDCGDSPHVACSAPLSGPVSLVVTTAPGVSIGGWKSAPCADAGTSATCDLVVTGPIRVAGPQLQSSN